MLMINPYLILNFRGQAMQTKNVNVPTPAFIGASWAVLGVGLISFAVGLWNAEMALSEKGYYFAVMVLALYSAVSLQKTVRDKAEGMMVSHLYYMISWAALITAIILMAVGLWNATLTLSEKGFYALAFTMSGFAVITIQKNMRDLHNAQTHFTEELMQSKVFNPLDKME